MAHSDEIDIDTFEHKNCVHTHSNSALPKTLPKTKINCRLLNIVTNRRERPKFYFELNKKFYFYGYRGITADYKIVLFCSKNNCGNYATITASKFLKEIIRNSPTGSKSQKTFEDTSNPKIYDVKNYDIDSFEIYGAHKCPGIEANHDKCKLIKIAHNRGHPNFHLEINGRFYVHGYRGIKADYTIVSVCKETNCGNSAFIVASEFFKKIIRNAPEGSKFVKRFVDKTDPKIYDLRNYDINSFEISGVHKCLGIEPDHYKEQCKLVKIVKGKRDVPHFHFEINGKYYVYRYRGIRANYIIFLVCIKKRCEKSAIITASEVLREIIKNSSKNSRFPQTFVDLSDPKVYDMKNYDNNSFEICRGHTCPGIEPDQNQVEYNLVKIAKNRGHPNFHFEINGKFYAYGYRGIKADYRIVLACKETICGNWGTIVPSEFLKGMIQNFSKSSKYEKSFKNKLDPEIYDLQNYYPNSFEISGTHKCSGKLDLENMRTCRNGKTGD